MPQLNLFGNTSIFPDTGSTDIFGNQSTDIFAAEENASDDILKMILKMCKSLHGLITTMMKMI